MKKWAMGFVLLLAGSSLVFGWGAGVGAAKPDEKKKATAAKKEEKPFQSKITVAETDESGKVVVTKVEPEKKGTKTNTVSPSIGERHQTEKRNEQIDQIREYYIEEREKASTPQEEQNSGQQNGNQNQTQDQNQNP